VKKMKYAEKFRECFTSCRVPSPGDGRYNEAIHALSEFVDANLDKVRVEVEVTRHYYEVRLETKMTYYTPTGALLEDATFSRVLDLEADVVNQIKRFASRLITLREESARNQLRVEREETEVEQDDTPCDLPEHSGTCAKCPECDAMCMTKEQTEEHLAPLRTHYGMSDQDMIALAEQGKAHKADHHAWLVLLGRGDLIR
jgi:hypothetical protein